MSETSNPNLTLNPETSGKEVAIASSISTHMVAFKRHKIAIVALWVIGIMYLLMIFVEFVAPDDPFKQNRRAVYHPPQMIHFIDHSEEGANTALFLENETRTDP